MCRNSVHFLVPPVFTVVTQKWCNLFVQFVISAGVQNYSKLSTDLIKSACFIYRLMNSLRTCLLNIYSGSNYFQSFNQFVKVSGYKSLYQVESFYVLTFTTRFQKIRCTIKVLIKINYSKPCLFIPKYKHN